MEAIFSIIILAILSLKLSASVTASVAISFILIYYLFKSKVRNKIIKIISLSSLCLITCFGTIYSYDNILRKHQKNYIKGWLNLEKDPNKIKQMERTILYNLNESKKAISSGCLTGKGFLKGTQGYLEFLPEKHTDFIFTLFSEEHGFIGSLALLFIYSVIIDRIMSR